MAGKKSKVINQLKKKVKKLEARVDELTEELDGLREGTKTTSAASIFSAEELETAQEVTDEAEEVLDILEKT